MKTWHIFVSELNGNNPDSRMRPSVAFSVSGSKGNRHEHATPASRSLCLGCPNTISTTKYYPDLKNATLWSRSSSLGCFPYPSVAFFVSGVWETIQTWRTRPCVAFFVSGWWKREGQVGFGLGGVDGAFRHVRQLCVVVVMASGLGCS